MKIHNYGSDYAYQLEQKKAADIHVKPLSEPTNQTDYAEYQIPDGGPSDLEESDNAPESREALPYQETEKANRRKKKERTDNQ